MRGANAGHDDERCGNEHWTNAHDALRAQKPMNGRTGE
jgi:hypothetical protein